MPDIKQKILRIVLAISLILAPMASAVATMSMSHSDARLAYADIVDHSAVHYSVDVQQDTGHCAGNSDEPDQDFCIHSCCGHCSLSMTFVVSQDVLVHRINSIPPFVNAMQASFTAFTHFRPPA